MIMVLKTAQVNCNYDKIASKCPVSSQLAEISRNRSAAFAAIHLDCVEKPAISGKPGEFVEFINERFNYIYSQTMNLFSNEIIIVRIILRIMVRKREKF